MGGVAATVAAAALPDGNSVLAATPATTVYLTSDDGPEAGTSTVIDLAEKHQVPVTLFMIGMNVAAEPEHQRILQRAQESAWVSVGNHSYSHFLMHYAASYHKAESVVADFERANPILGLSSYPVVARAPGRNVWRLPGLSFDDPAISHSEEHIEDTTDDDLFAAGFHLYGWDVEWLHTTSGVPVQSSATMVAQILGAGGRRPGQVVVLMHDIMMRSSKAADEFERIVDGLGSHGVSFGRLADY